MGHYGFMAAFGFTVVGTGVLASLRPAAWRVAAWTTGSLPVVLGLTSIIYPNVASSLDLIWTVAAIAWGAVFIGASEVSKKRQSSAVLGVRGPASTSESPQGTKVGP